MNNSNINYSQKVVEMKNITKKFGSFVANDNINLTVHKGEVHALLGENGAGKSTLMNILYGLYQQTSGEIYINEKLVNMDNPNVAIANGIGMVHQHFMLVQPFTVAQNIILGVEPTKGLGSIDINKAIEDVKAISEKYGLYVDPNAKIEDISVGMQQRVEILKALYRGAEILILDEPTNHLDNETISWLEEYLNSRKGALLMITHDRYFLDRVTNRILELDRGRLFSYDGNYSVFLEKKMERIAIEKASEEKRQNLMRKELAWVRRGAKARTTKQKARLQRFDELVNQEGFIENENIEISVMGTRLGKKIIEIEHLNKSFGDKKIVDDFNYIVLRSDRIGIVGPNGIGKSTLMGMIEGKVAPDSGEIIKGETVKIACFSQEDTHMHPEMRAIDYIKEAGEYLQTATGERITASQMCEKFLFDGTLQWTMIGMLSGGERRRLHLLRVLMEAPNVLLLDEPTNDLDIETLNRLEDYLDDFGGVVITVSHDRYFLDRICNKIFSYKGNGKIDIYTGNYGDYLLSKEEEAVNNKEKEVAVDKNKKEPSVDKNKNKGKVLKFSFKEQREFETIDEEIMTLEEKIEELDSLMAKHASEYGRLQELMEEKAKVEEELAFKYERWEYLNELAAQIEENKKNK